MVCANDHGGQSDVVFVIEATAVNGAYIGDLRSNYIVPTLEYFSQGTLAKIDDNTLVAENAISCYGIVTYQAADCLPNLTSDTFGPFYGPGKVLSAIDKLELIGGKGESHANIAEGLATAMCCLEELQLKRDPNILAQKHCILICNSPPYLMPVFECQTYAGKNAEQLASILQEKNINLSIISPRKIPQLYKLFEKAGGDLSTQTKNYAKDPRHLVLLKGFTLKERAVTPPPGSVPNQSQLVAGQMPVTSMSSPLPGNDSPIHNNQMGTPQNPNMMGNNSPTVVQSGMGQSPVYRSPNHQVGRIMASNQQLNQMGMQGMPAPPGYPTGARPGWQMPPPPVQQPPRPYLQVNPNNPQQNPNAGGSALIAQLNQPPSMNAGNVNQFNQLNANPSMNKLLSQQQQNMPNSSIQSSISQNSQVVTSQAQGTQPPVQQNVVRERQNIWSGMLEWIEKPKNPADQLNKVTRQVPCQVTAYVKEGEPELKADGWPPKLIMQLMPKQLINTIGGSHLKNSKTVSFHPTQCEALESLTKMMLTGFAGCVHFTGNSGCDLKVLLLLYVNDRKAYLGFIPNDQVAFVDRLRKVIQQQKIRPGGNGPQMMNQTGQQQQMAMQQQQQQQQQQTMMMSQANAMSMAGGQIAQNMPPGRSLGPQNAGMQSGQQMNQSAAGMGQIGATMSQQQQGTMGGMNQMGGNMPQSGNIGQTTMGGMMQQNLNPQQQQQQQQAQNQGNMQQTGMMGQQQQQQQQQQLQRQPPYENQLQVERQQNLDKINKLKQTLEAAQQQEQQYKSQLEQISHMKTTHLQEALLAAQNTEMQYKLLDQRLAAQSNLQVQQTNNPQQQQQQQQQRMIRPVMTNNPGLRHLLQQQPQFRQQIMQQMGNTGRGQIGQQQQQQQQNPQTGQPNQFDDVPNFDFM